MKRDAFNGALIAPMESPAGAAEATAASRAAVVDALLLFELHTVRVRLGPVQALHDVTLQIRHGERVALVGANGCGKSTLLRLLNGLLQPAAGHITRDAAARQALLFQRPHMLRTTARNNIALGLWLGGQRWPAARTRAAEALARVGMTDLAGRNPNRLSGGQQQRVAIARAIVTEPTLVLMDEPLSNLDAKLRQEMRQEIRRIHLQSGATTVYVTHDQEEALSLADRIVVMRDGRVQQVGAPDALFNTPVDLDVADFMGFRNRLPGRVLARTGDSVTVAVQAASSPATEAHCGELTGKPRHEVLGDKVVIAVRPCDLMVQDTGRPGLGVTVELTEYLGRGFQVLGRTADEQSVHFLCDRQLLPGERVTLTTDPARALVFPA